MTVRCQSWRLQLFGWVTGIYIVLVGVRVMHTRKRWTLNSVQLFSQPPLGMSTPSKIDVAIACLPKWDQLSLLISEARKICWSLDNQWSPASEMSNGQMNAWFYSAHWPSILRLSAVSKSQHWISDTTAHMFMIRRRTLHLITPSIDRGL